MDGGRRLGVEFYVMPEADKEPFKAKLAPFYADYQRRYAPAEWNGFFEAVRRTAP
jgi:hypothetical protein